MRRQAVTETLLVKRMGVSGERIQAWSKQEDMMQSGSLAVIS